ncbi:beta-galactosidase [Nakamurella sp. GG22]
MPERPEHTDRPGWPTAGIAYGGDYNPEQWPEEIWPQDVALMREAGITVVTVGVFSWARLQPEPSSWDDGWLLRILDLLHDNGIAVDLATATASPPPWLARLHPEIRPVDAAGTRLEIGSRQTWCPSSPVFREYSLDLVRRLAGRFADHPAVRMWHVSNELGNHNAYCYCDVSTEHFRRWVADRYGDVETLNRSWGTAFWSQHYSSFDEIGVPSATTAFGNPGQLLDWRRFSSDALLDQYRAEKAVLREISPAIPVTTNFTVGMGPGEVGPGPCDYARWAPEQDVVSTDHYLIGLGTGERSPRLHLEFSADLTRGLAGGLPWWLMEHSTSAVNWQPINRAKEPGEMERNSLAHLARGADAICFFQFRQSVIGAEKYHSAMLPHAGADSRRWRDVCALGKLLGRLGEIAGSRVEASAAVLVDWDSAWAGQQEANPSAAVQHFDVAMLAHRAISRTGTGCDVIPVGADLSGYRVIVVPAVTVLSGDTANRLASAAEGGAHVLVTYFSGIADTDNQVVTGGYPGVLRDLVGVRTEEFFPLGPGVTVRWDDGTVASGWVEDTVAAAGTDVLARYSDGPTAGFAALTRRGIGDGAFWYLSCQPDAAGMAAVTARILRESGAAPAVPLPADDPAVIAGEVDVVRRRSGNASWLFALNHSTSDVVLPARGVDLVTKRTLDGDLMLPAGGWAVVREAR